MLHVVLHEPEIPANTGNIARTCAATGSVLHLIKPLGFDISDKAVKRAGLDYWYLMTYEVHESWQAFLEKYPGATLHFATTKAPRDYCQVQYGADDFLVFGRETRGLPETLLKANYERCVRIPMISEARSLNLSNSIAIGVYEVLRQWDFPALSEAGRLRGYDWDAADANGAK